MLEDVRISVDDWAPMRDLARDLLRSCSPRARWDRHRGGARSGRALEWLVDDHFTFVGACAYVITGDGDTARLEPQVEGALGTARRRALRDPVLGALTSTGSAVLTLTKAVERSTVHRTVPLDDVRVRQFDERGRAVGEVRFIGLYTASVYTDSIERIPVLRRKAAGVIARAGTAPGEHEERTLTNVLETLPRELLFRLPVDARATRTGRGSGRTAAAALLRGPDEFGRFVSPRTCPRSVFTVRTAIVDALLQAFDATSVDSVLVGDR